MEEGTNPHNLIVGNDGIVWYTGNRNARIGRLDPINGDIKTFPMPDAAARDPHTLVFGKNGVLWFTVQGGNYVGRLEPVSGKVSLVKVPTNNARPYGIAIDSKGRAWVNLFGVNKLAAIDPVSMALTEIDLPRADARSRRIAITSDDRIWYVDYMGGYLGKYDPVTRKFEEWALPAGGNARPYAMAVDGSDRLWMVETGPQPNLLVGFDSKRHQFAWSAAIPSGALVVRHMYFHPQSKEIWFGTDAGTIGRAKLP
jgi:virginiamycin B lyase